MTNTLIYIGLLILLIVIVSQYSDNEQTDRINKTENFGALQSLYSNDGIQDSYLTVRDDDAENYDPYKYWRGVTWDLPTRNLNSLVYYPYLYEYQFDRYGRVWPYW